MRNNYKHVYKSFCNVIAHTKLNFNVVIFVILINYIIIFIKSFAFNGSVRSSAFKNFHL